MGARLRVVYLDHCARLSGAELALLRLLPSLVDEVEAHVVLAEDGPLVAKLEAVGISNEVVPLAEATRELARDRVRLTRLSAATLLSTARYTAAIASLLRRQRPDLVHTNSLKSGLYGSLAGRLAGVPAVWHLREHLTAGDLPPATLRMVKASIRHLPAAVIANSRSTLRHVSTPGLISTAIPSPIEVRVIHAPQPAGAPLRVGMVGRLAPLKGQDVFLEAFARAFPSADLARAVIVGSPLFGETSYEEQLRDLVARLGLEDRVEMTGFRDDIGAELGRLDVLVQASVTAEGFGQVVVEGMAAGLAVIAPRAGGPEEIVTDGYDGLLCPPGDVAALASTLRRLHGDEPLRRRLGQAGRQRALDFTPAVIAPQVVAFYHAVLQATSGKERMRQ